MANQCPHCKKELQEDMIFCPYCGSTLHDDAAENLQEVETGSDDPIIADTEAAISNRKTKAGRKWWIVALVSIVVLAGAAVGAYFGTANLRAYAAAEAALEAQSYDSAIAQFEALGDYEDSADRALQAKYAFATSLYEDNSYEDAVSLYEELGNYSDAADKAKEAKYDWACESYEAEDYGKAEELFLSLGDYNDAEQMAEQSAYLQTTDGQFMKAISEGLQARWKYIDDFEQGKTEDHFASDADYLSYLVDIEHDLIQPFVGESFEDRRLGEIASEYNDVLESCYAALKYYTVNVSAYNSMWDSARAERTHLLAELYEDYGLTVSDEYKADLNNLISDSEVYYEQEELKRSVNAMFADASLTVDPYIDDWSGDVLWYSYSITITNITDYTFEYIYADVQVLDENGDIIARGSCGSVNNLAPGQSASVDLYVDNGDEYDISEYDLSFTPHYSTGRIFE